MNYLDYIEKIKAAACEVLHDAKGHKIYRIPYNGRHILVRLWSEGIDGKEIFHNGCQYQRHDENKSAVPITWTYISPKDFCNEFLANEIQELRIVRQRHYGQPKLKKPSVCKNINLIGSVEFVLEKPVKCRVWRAGNVIYVLHRDWFSEGISYDEAKRRGLVGERKNKFIYNDNFGGVILRNEAVISFGVPNNVQNLMEQLARLLGEEWYQLHNLHRWEDFFGDILKLCN